MSFKSNPENINRTGANKSKRTKEWEKLGEYLVNEGAQRFIKHLMASGDKEFQEEYLAILNYFKPRMKQSEITVSEVPTIQLLDSGKVKSNGQDILLN